MKIMQQLGTWSSKLQSGFTDVLRIALGLILFVKGYQLIFNLSNIVQSIQHDLGFTSVLFAEILIALHLFLGIFIVIGLATRLACLIMIPILSVAILFVNSNISVNGVGELILSIVTLFLLLFFLLVGNGQFSVYKYITNSKRSRLTDDAKVEYKSNGM